MGVSTVLSAAVLGLRVEFVNVEADVSNGLPSFQMVGYLSSEVREAAERVRTAIRNSGLEFPAKKTIINLAPATMKKRGAAFDLPIALGILMSLGMFEEARLRDMLVVGELSLDGKVKKISGILPIVLEAKAAGVKICMVPKENASEGALVEGIQILGVDTLLEAYKYLCGKLRIEPESSDMHKRTEENALLQLDYADICGQESVKRAVEIAVSGAHNLLMIGPPGSGKSMMAKRIPTILPPMTFSESIELTKIYSILGMVDSEEPLVFTRPFRSVHHTATKAALVGGGMIPAPGEISLAHEGVLFLDELPEFQKNVLEVLRQPLEDRIIRITRTHGNYQFPANFMLVAAMNPCPCGCYPDTRRCICTPGQIQHYLGKISQPFLDRIDICVEAPRISYESLKNKKKAESSAQIRERVVRARKIQQKRFAEKIRKTNAAMGIQELEQFCSLGEAEERIVRQAFTTFNLTARTYHKILKVARTIADLAGEEKIRKIHLQEALSFRTPDQKYWKR